VKPEGESAAAIFERINRRRAELAPPLAGASTPDRPAARDSIDPRPIRAHVDEVLFKGSNPRFPDAPWQQRAKPTADGPGERPGTGSGPGEHPATDADPAADRFPRSATMRLILKHPALALGLGVPAAGLLLKSPASRRLLGMAVRVGTGPELQTLMRLSTIAARSDPPSPPVSPDFDKPLP